MGNPAELLLAQFQRWAAPQTAPPMARGLKGQKTVDALWDHVDAMARIRAIAEAIDALEANNRRVDQYRRMLPEWIKAVLAYPAGWSDQSAHQRLFHPHSLDLLGALADAIDHSIPAVIAEDDHVIWKILDDIAGLLDSDEQIDPKLKAYIHQLLQHVRNCLEDFQGLGAFELREALARLWVAVQAAETQASPENKSQLRKLWEAIWPSAAGGALGSIPQLALTTGMAAGGA